MTAFRTHVQKVEDSSQHLNRSESIVALGACSSRVAGGGANSVAIVLAGRILPGWMDTGADYAPNCNAVVRAAPADCRAQRPGSAYPQRHATSDRCRVCNQHIVPGSAPVRLQWE
jgi:hypothetical protein